jgi:L-asparagine transporter-like permease
LDWKPAFLNIKVFAVFSYYFEKKYFSFIQNDAGEEIIIIFILVGLLLVSFSKLKAESELTVIIRIKAIFLSVYINTFFLVLSAAFIYGMGFMAITVINCFSLLLINLFVFQVILLKQKKQSRLNGSLL